jgi:hypothetical protein
MSKIRVTVEWPFGGVLALFPFLDAKKSCNKIRMGPCASYYRVGILLYNAHFCAGGGGVHGNEVGQFFACSPPTLEEYFA